MCYRTNCPVCQKPTYGGCGAHIEQALAGVPKDSRCKCREAAATTNTTAGSNQPRGGR